jgi:YidC/Oxa1 family membrane protein insertase
MSSDQKNALFAILLSGLILFGWQFYFAPPTVITTTPSDTSSPAQPVPESNLQVSPIESGPIEPVATTETITLQGNGISIKFNSLLSVLSMTHEKSAFAFEDLFEDASSFHFEVAYNGQKFQKVVFETVEQTSSQWVGVEKTLGLRAEINLNSRDFAGFKISSDTPFKYRYSFSSTPKKLENGQERQFAFYDKSLELWSIGSEELADTKVHWAGIDYNYHLFGLSFAEAPGLVVRGIQDNLFQLFTNSPVNEVKFDLIFTIKEYNHLTSLGRYLKHAINFGFWGFFAELILKGLQFFYSLIPNYGVAIILLTFIVRLITFPLQYKSFVSMKKMQLIQPELTKIREKFKDDPMRLQKESMDLFKKSGANPLGGCLPMLLQLPVFFAFYKVLYSAVELVDAPFIGWLVDLSNKDPYFILPLLMTGAMFLQQKLTPTTVTDPVQKKVFMFMPIIFGFVMKDLPSGLSLYIFTSTLLAIAQQTLVFKITGGTKAVVV